VLAQRVNNFQIAPSFSVFRSKHAHRGEERDTPFAVAVEASQEEHGLASDVFDTGLGDGNTRFLREGQCDRFPDHRVDFIVLAWEFRDGEMATLFPDGSRQARSRALRPDQPSVLIILCDPTRRQFPFFVHIMVGIGSGLL
jgi:hypothetical protein